MNECIYALKAGESRDSARDLERSGKVERTGSSERGPSSRGTREMKEHAFLLNGKDASEGRRVLTVRIPECKDYSLRSIDKQTAMTCPHAPVQKYAAI